MPWWVQESEMGGGVGRGEGEEASRQRGDCGLAEDWKPLGHPVGTGTIDRDLFVHIMGPARTQAAGV